MSWTIILLSEVRAWYDALTESDPDTADAVASAIDLLEDQGPQLGRPTVDTLKGSTLTNLKELRSGSIRILFVFDPERQAILLTAGDKAGQWQTWYDEHIPLAEQRYAQWLAGAFRDEED